MNDVLMIAAAFFLGMAAGCFFLKSLWWTVRQLPTTPRPLRLMLLGFLVRMGVVLGVMTGLATSGDWRLLVASGVGFALIRTVGVRTIAQRGVSFQLADNSPLADNTPSQAGSLRHDRFRHGRAE